MKDKLSVSNKKIHFIGIGGIGVSALAQYYSAKGCKVTGSDLVFSEIIEKMEQSGIKVFLGPHRAENVPKDVDLIIHSPAVQPDNPELVKGVKAQSYPQALGDLTENYFTIAVSGTHGKSTTCSMIALLLIKAGLDPTVFVGTRLKELDDNNFRIGKSKYLVIEADEWQASFLNYYPKIIILTNVEKEHLDYYKDLDNILKTYQEYISHLDKDGLLIFNKDDKNILKLNRDSKTKEYSLKQEETGELRKILKIPGEHNIYNALACLAVGRSLNVPDDVSFKALSEYKGAWRRFEVKKAELNNKKFTLISDYGHHPTEVEATLKAAKEGFPNKKIWCVFQPHQYQRTFYLFNNFVKVFSEPLADKIIITDIFDVVGREEGDIKKRVSSKQMVEKVNKPEVIYLAKGKVKNYLEDNLQGNEVVIIMGAGDVYKILDTFD